MGNVENADTVPLAGTTDRGSEGQAKAKRIRRSPTLATEREGGKQPSKILNDVPKYYCTKR
jgi:hypothetical protein